MLNHVKIYSVCGMRLAVRLLEIDPSCSHTLIVASPWYTVGVKLKIMGTDIEKLLE